MEDQENIRRIVENAVNQALVEKPKKPEHMTHLRGDQLVEKDNKRIAFRGAIDSLEAEIILYQTAAEKKALTKLVEDLQETIVIIRRLLRCEVSGEPVGEVLMLGMDTDTIHDHSHHPSKYYGVSHFLPTYKHGEIVAYLNKLRTKARATELIAFSAFKTENGVEREDIIRVLNRLSSLYWVMMFQYLTGKYGDQK